MNEAYIIKHLTLLISSGVKSGIVVIFLYITTILKVIEPYFFGSHFIRILAVLMVCDLLAGIGKHIKLKNYSGKQMFNKFTFKLLTVMIATVSAKVMIDIDYALDTNILIVAVKLTIALYLFGNIEKNICQLTEKKLCFNWLINKFKEIFNILKTQK